MATSADFALPPAVARHFDLANTPYTPDFCARVQARRQAFPDRKLFLDRILEAGDVQVEIESVYPSSTPASLRRLLNAVAASSLPRAQQDVLFYYLLKDYDLALPIHRDARGEMIEDDGVETRSRAEDFAAERCLPELWVVFSEAYWCLDNEEWELAIKHLTNPVLSDLNFLPEILQTLSTRASPPAHSLGLVRRLLLHSQHVAQSENEIQLQLVSLASAGSLEEAFALVRDVGDDKLRSQLRERLWTWTLGVPSFPAGSGQVSAQKDVLRQLTHLPLDDEEVEHLGDFLKHPPRSLPPQNLSILHDLVTLRMVHQGQYAASIELDKASAESAGKDSDRQRRREMVREFIAILPEVQRRSLAIEGELTTARREHARDEFINGDVDMDGPVVQSLTPAPIPLRVDASMAQPPQASSPAGNATPRNVSRTQSPFSGPPRFASTQQSSPDLRHRVMSGPFAPPRVVSNGSPAPKLLPKRLINDDDEEARPKSRKAPRSFGVPRTPVPAESQEAPVEPERDAEVEQTPVPDAESGPSTRRSTRRATRATSVASSRATSEAPQAVSPVLESPPAHRTRRQTSQPPTPTMPGGFAQHQVNPPQAVPEYEVLQLDAPERPTIGNGRPSTANARTTRSVSGAQLDDDEDGRQAGGQRKKTKTTRTSRAAREQTADSTMPETPRTGRMTRASTRASTVGPSEQGSPTPSVASVATDGRRRNTRAGSAAAQTPRQTRARRH